MAARGLPPPLGAEFPNDNPELFGGATWRVQSPCAAPRVYREPTSELLHYPKTRPASHAEQAARSEAMPIATRSLPSEVESRPPALEAIVPAEVRAVVAVDASVAAECEAPVEPSLDSTDAARLLEAEAVRDEPPPVSAEGANDFDRFVKSLVGEALKRGETRAAAQLQHFLESEELSGEKLPEVSRRMLIERGFVVDDRQALRPTPALRAVLSSWRRTLSGQDGELDAARDETLDQWASSLLGAWLGCAQDKLPTLRRALRKSGVLAFGMRAA